MRTLWGVIALLPAFAGVAAIPLVNALSNIPPGGSIPYPAAELVVAAAGLIAGLAAIVVYVIRIAGDEALGDSARTKWILAAVILNGVALPAYWWRRIR